MIGIPLLDVSGPPRRGQGEKIHASKKAYKFKRIVKKVFGSFDVTRGGLQDGRRTESLHFIRFFATSRFASFLQCKRPRKLIIPCKNERILCRESTTEGKRKNGAFSPFVRVPWGPQRPPKEVLKIRGGLRSSRQLDSLHFYSVLLPPR